MAKKFIFVMGGVMSGVGKGVTAASIGKILQSRGYNATAIKIDPYINVDAGTMNPTEHGEVFVTEDGDETDQDIGNYERFLDINIYRANYLTTGRIYQSVIQRERNLEYGGKCVEVVPHIPQEVIDRIRKAAVKSKADITIIEIGGTVGEYQNILFLEAARLMHYKNPEDVLFILVSYLPIPGTLGEMKTKPTQYAVQQVNAAGIQPDFIVCRSEKPVDAPRRQKISTFCNVPREHVISNPDVESIYEIPLILEQDRFSDKIIRKLGLKPKKRNMDDWRKMMRKFKAAQKRVKIGMVGKYFATGDFILPDSYISVIESVKHAATANGVKAEIDWINSDAYEKNPALVKELKNYGGIIVPGGFGKRGVEGKILAIKYARENKIPYLGLCYGMQLATIEFARNVVKLKGANTTEINEKTKYPVIHIMPDQAEKLAKKQYGNTMRLGAYPCVLDKNSKSFKAYGRRRISERHRHRYEFNNDYRARLTNKGLLLAGLSPDKKLVEIIEIPSHPFFVGTQFHPEFKSRPLKPHPLFREFVSAAKKKSKK
ncbi:MAG: CTP synthase [Candidatus Buchananbacteria bacterium RIFCSPHIGHO2_02_FULL_38_8]|uniref:CTP synthase n=1 Tax=Candidatus Buchananbacteria bacterium RIFCSPHIGHO2_02_FULL_38_8 TaxID=1797538 RepID=A0A1G1Y5W6_9BACT|nr:MAG: CTP synthase [Candidatus Buchananbacteria bacterium RIFCSPHIGHO2_02_FULL_38_8]